MRWVIIALLCSAAASVSGCAGNSALIKASGTGSRSDVFEERAAGGIGSQGTTELLVNATLKTHNPGIYSEADIHGTPEYRLLLNIDGQAAWLQGRLERENFHLMRPTDPEAGDGVRYRFGTHLRLKAGVHRIVAALPGDGIAVEKEIYLIDATVNDLVIEPVYSPSEGKRRPGVGLTSFKQGIRTIRLLLNGREL